ncbi:MAG: acetyl-CoA carboxylase carboxyltransferase subunit alpha [Anaerovoracaceae bacterium]
MDLKNLFKKTSKRKVSEALMEKPEVPEGLFVKCSKCGAMVSQKDLAKNFNICTKCKGNLPLNAENRLKMILEKDSFEKWGFNIKAGNPLGIEGYEEKVKENQKKTGMDEAVISGSGMIGKTKVAIAVCDSSFMMASMGYYVGEHLTRTITRAMKQKLPLIIVAASGGARMQEGIVSLMQMAKTSAALKKYNEAGLLYISVLTDPTTGGVTASFAMLGDIILAEPKALIGFAGPRVIEQTIGEKLPEGFQRSEFLLEKGFVDKIVERNKLKETLDNILELHINKNVKAKKEGGSPDFIKKLFKKNEEVKKEKTPWEIVKLSRANNRPCATDYIEGIFTDFVEFHGDRYGGDDKAIIGGICRFAGKPVTVVAQAKGRDTEENIYRNFGMPSPEGYRKSLRLMKEAEKFGRPIICLVDTPGAYCGISAEEHGQGEAIARNLYEMSDLTVPVLTIVIGEAGSGGALAMAVANEVYMLENSIYSILSPEGYASILWKDGKKAEKAAEVMKLTAKDLKELSIIEDIIMEPENFTREKMKNVNKIMTKKIMEFLIKYEKLSKEEIVSTRFDRFMKM